MKIFSLFLFVNIIIISIVESSQLISAYTGGNQIRDFSLSQCDTKANYTIQLRNVKVQVSTNPIVIVTGTFTTTADLTTPIKANVEVWHKVLFWIKLPCEKNVGSCTYQDLCHFGIPDNKDCPNFLDDNKIPCRCPINKGTYIIPATLPFELESQSPLLDGTYTGSINLFSNNTNLGCYNFSFKIIDQLDNKKNEYLIYSNKL